jgi:colanic acid/amylovoran biosynthesis glycosyltransferase
VAILADFPLESIGGCIRQGCLTRRMRRVLIYRTDVLPISETFILAQANALKSFQPRFIGLCRPDPSLEVPADSILLTGRRTLRSIVRKRLYWKTGIAPRFHRAAAEAGAALIHAHFGPDGMTAARIAEQLGLPLIVTLHGYDVTIPRKSPTTYARLWERASLFLCVSKFIRDRAIEAGFPPEKLRVHSIGIDLSQFNPNGTHARPDSILFVSRLVQKKGCEYLLRAMEIVQRTRPGAELTVIGDGVLKPQLEELAKNLGVRSRFMGGQPSYVVRKALQSTRVFCVPSVTADNGDSEGLGMVFAEAQAMGVPVASFEHGGIPEIVQNGISGFLAPERDHVRLAEGILRYLSDDLFWQQSRMRGIDWIQNRFNIETHTAELEAIYSDVISRFRANA